MKSREDCAGLTQWNDAVRRPTSTLTEAGVDAGVPDGVNTLEWMIEITPEAKPAQSTMAA